jgi:hypothetical protein
MPPFVLQPIQLLQLAHQSPYFLLVQQVVVAPYRHHGVGRQAATIGLTSDGQFWQLSPAWSTVLCSLRHLFPCSPLDELQSLERWVL